VRNRTRSFFFFIIMRN